MDSNEPKDPIDQYDSEHGKPKEDARLANPPVATADTEQKCFNTKGDK